MASDPQTLLRLAQCYNCHPDGHWLLFRIGLELEALQILNPAVDISADSFLDQAKCYVCLTPGFWAELQTALTLKWAQAMSPTFSINPNDAGCLACLPAGELTLVDLGGLANHIQGALDTSADALLNLTRCYLCLPREQQLLVELGILKSIVNRLTPTVNTDPGPLLNDPVVRQIPPTITPAVRTLIILDGVSPRAPYPNFTWSPDPLPDATGGVAYSQAITAAGSTPPVTFVLSSGAFPPGITISGAGVISGTPTDIGLFHFTIQATDSNGIVDFHSWAFTVLLPADLEVSDWVARVIANGGSVSAPTNLAADIFMFRLKVTNPTLRAKIYRLNFFAGTGFNPVLPNQGAPTIPLIKDQGAVKDTWTGTAPAYTETGPTGGVDLAGGFNGRIDTALVPNLVYPSANTAHVAFYVCSLGPVAFNYVGMCATAGGSGLGIAMDNSGTWLSQLNDGAGTVEAGPAPIALLAGNRSAANACQIYRRGNQTNTSAVAAVALPDRDFTPFCLHGNVPAYSGFWFGRCAGYSIGLSMTGAEHLAFYNAWQEFQTALGRQV